MIVYQSWKQALTLWKIPTRFVFRNYSGVYKNRISIRVQEIMERRYLALLMNEHAYCGREYLSALISQDIYPDVLIIGSYPTVDRSEEDRCGGLWRPVPMHDISSYVRIFHFENLKDGKLLNHIKEQGYLYCIQGGTGIISRRLINAFAQEILNFHPGALPSFRGCSAPEWQISEGKPVIATCHFLDEGIDSGDIVATKRLELNMTSYNTFRASIYPQISQFVVDIIKRIIGGDELTAYEQDENVSRYRPYIGDDAISDMIDDWANLTSLSNAR